MARKFDELLKKMSPERQARIEAKRRAIEKEILEEDLRGIRELAGKTQVEVAEALELSQGKVSDVERRDDHLVSTLRRYVEALGGELEVTATFGDKKIRLHGV
jgi:predicted transcriptional regulator